MDNLDIFDISGSKIGDLKISSGFFINDINFAVIKQVVDWQNSKIRGGLHQTKNIATVNGTTAKPHRQKGTGRARQGNMRSVHCRGGVKSFGPNLRNYSYRLNKKIRIKALHHAISFSYTQKKLLIIDSFDQIGVRVKDLLNIIQNFSCIHGISDRDDVLFVAESFNDMHFASSNIKTFNLLPRIGLNVYDVMKHDFILMERTTLLKLITFIGF